MPFNDVPIVPNIGVFASKDPVAIDSACVDKVTELAAIPNCQADEYGVGAAGQEKFTIGSSLMGVNHDIQLKVGEKIGLGIREYNLIEIEPGEPEYFRPREIPLGKYMAEYYKHDHPFPEKGFKRRDEVDLSFLTK